MKTHFPRAALAALFALSAQSALAGSATWDLNPSSDNWFTATNWTPANVPNGTADIATFGVSSQTSVTLNRKVTLDSIVFGAGASPYTITDNGTGFTIIDGAGIMNNSGVEQHLVFSNVSDVNLTNSATITGPVSIYLAGEPMMFGQNSANLLFLGASSAGSAAITASPTNSTYPSSIGFRDSTSAGDAVFTVAAGTDAFRFGAFMYFDKSSTAANATITLEGASSVAGGFGSGAAMEFLNNSTAAFATITVNGGAAEAADGATLEFISGQTANSTLIINGGTNGGLGGQLWFAGPSTNGAQPRVEVFGNATFLAWATSTVGSLEGDGQVYLRFFNLTIGANGLSTVFSGTIQDGDFAGGSLTKIGSGTFTLASANLYTGGTTVSEGILTVSNQSGSATGTGALTVNAGTLAGAGIISGPVTVGTGSGNGAFIAPAAGARAQTSLTLQSSLTLQADATYTYTFKAKKKRARTDLVTANGITIASGATFSFSGQAQGKLRQGLTLTVLSNTSANPISGTFSNLPDGAIVTVNGNNFQANYEGGDGNDLTLTVQ